MVSGVFKHRKVNGSYNDVINIEGSISTCLYIISASKEGHRLRLELRADSEGRISSLLEKEKEVQHCLEEEKEELLMLTACANAIWRKKEQQQQQKEIFPGNRDMIPHYLSTQKEMQSITDCTQTVTRTITEVGV